MNNDENSSNTGFGQEQQERQEQQGYQERQESYRWTAGADDGRNGSYRWSYSDVSSDSVEQKLRVPNTGLRVFLIIIAVIIVMVIGLFAVMGAWDTFVRTEKPTLPDGDTAQSRVEITLPPAESMPEIDKQDKPYSADGAGERLTPAEIYRKCSRYVVGVITYYDDTHIGTAQGSGIIISEDGYIITNAHVISGGIGYDVVMPDGEYYSAFLMGYDNQTDIAVLKIEDGGVLPYATFGDSAELEVGEMVAVIGNPDGLNLATTQTIGYVSALGRVIETESTYTMECIQTDAAINPGSSGGPLINEYGQVVGVASAKLAAVDYEGIGFAIPINTALPIAQDLILNGKVTGRAMLGITVQEVITHAMSEYYGLPAGIVIDEISEGSGMQGTQAQPGDIVVSIDGEEISTLGECSAILSRYKPGDIVSVRLFHISNTFSSSGSYFDIEIPLSGS